MDNYCDLKQKLEIVEQNKTYELLELFQEEVLNKLSTIENFSFVFTGGTALTKVHLDNHRRSYDLDYFGTFKNNTNKEIEVKFKDINVYIESFQSSTDENSIRIDRYIVSKEFQDKTITMKVEFVSDYFYGLFNPIIHKNWNADCIEAIYFRKIYALLAKDVNRIKDLIDIYYLNNIIDFKDFYTKTYLPKFKEYLSKQGFNLEFDGTILKESIDLFLKYIINHPMEVNSSLHSYNSSLKDEDIHKLFWDIYTKI